MPNRVAVNGVELNYEEYGGGDEKLVFVHGYNTRATLYTDVFALLPDHYHIYAFDLRSQGGSAHVTEDVTFDQWAEDVYQQARALGLTKFVYAGHSAGGGVGMKLALRHPECLKGLVLINTLPATGGDELPGELREQVVRSWRNPELIVPMLNGLLVRPYPAAKLAALVEAQCLVEREPFVHYFDHEITAYDVSGSLGDIETPTLVLYGAKDNVCLPAAQHQTAQGLPHGKEIIVPDEGHMMPFEAPEKTAQEMISFISQLH